MARPNLWLKRKQKGPKAPVRSEVFRLERAYQRRLARAEKKRLAQMESGHYAKGLIVDALRKAGELRIPRDEARKWHWVGDVSADVVLQRRLRHGKFEYRQVRMKAGK